MVGGNDPKLFDKFVSYCYCDFIYKSPSDNGQDIISDNTNVTIVIYLRATQLAQNPTIKCASAIMRNIAYWENCKSRVIKK